MIVRNRMKRALYVRLCVVLLYTSFQLSTRRVTVIAFPSSAGSCFAGDTAVRGIHSSRATTVKASLADLNIDVHFGSFLYENNSTIPVLQGVEYTWSVNAADQAFFRGILVRFQALEGQNMIGSILPDENTQLSAACVGPELIGLEHYDRSLKTIASGRFRLDQPGRVRVDVTVVIGNEPTLSLYGHDDFIIDVAYTGATPTTFSPIAAPYTISPTKAPVFTSVPVSAPVAVPAPVPLPIPVSIPQQSENNRKNQFNLQGDFR
jgi:hypothetical protein